MKNKIIINENPKSPISEAYRTLRTNIQFSSIDKEIKTIMVNSAGPSEGKSTTITNLAATTANNDKKVLIIDCDLRKPKVHTFFEISNASGLTTILADNIDYREAIQKSDMKNLDILTSGPIPPNPSEVLGSKRMKALLDEVKEDYDMILIDAPPVGMVTDGAVIGNIVDGVILVCAVGQANIDATKHAKASLEQANANILGVVMNKVPTDRNGYYKYNYYYYSQMQSYYATE